MTRKLTDDEKKLWNQEVSSVRKKKNEIKKKPLVDDTSMDECLENDDIAALETPAKSLQKAAKTLAPIANDPAQLPLVSGNYAGVDAATVRRIKRAQMAVSGRIDLHGMTQAEALPALVDFIKAALHQNKRLVLVITGKGRRSEAQEAGVLKTMLPRWLNTPELRPHILAFDEAQITHGGSGAFYILLRRNRL